MFLGKLDLTAAPDRSGAIKGMIPVRPLSSNASRIIDYVGYAIQIRLKGDELDTVTSDLLVLEWKIRKNAEPSPPISSIVSLLPKSPAETAITTRPRTSLARRLRSITHSTSGLCNIGDEHRLYSRNRWLTM
jgi:hypothetical protein